MGSPKRSHPRWRIREVRNCARKICAEITNSFDAIQLHRMLKENADDSTVLSIFNFSARLARHIPDQSGVPRTPWTRATFALVLGARLMHTPNALSYRYRE
jgi:hypothetical protein